MKIALLNPPLRQRYVHSIDEPLGILYLATALKAAHDVYIIDSFNHNLTVDETLDILCELDIDLLGISMIFAGAYKTSLDIAAQVKQKKPSVVTVLGGNTATFLADRLIRYDAIDWIVRGEGDITFPELISNLSLEKMNWELPGVSYVKNGQVVHTADRRLIKDLDRLPFPDREMLPLHEKYPRSILSSRGCSYGCIYCSASAFWGGAYRMRRVENIINEIVYLNEIRPLEYLTFADDCLTLVPQRAQELAQQMRRLKNVLKKDFTWGCSGRIETMSEDLIKEFSRAGCKGIFFGIESGSIRILRKLGRRYTPERVLEIYKMCLKYGIKPYFSFMVGLPFEEQADLELTFALIKKLKGVENGVHILTPFPGTAIYNEPNKYGLSIREYDIEDLDINSCSLVKTENLTREVIDEAYRKAIGYSFQALRKVAQG